MPQKFQTRPAWCCGALSEQQQGLLEKAYVWERPSLYPFHYSFIHRAQPAPGPRVWHGDEQRRSGRSAGGEGLHLGGGHFDQGSCYVTHGERVHNSLLISHN